MFFASLFVGRMLFANLFIGRSLFARPNTTKIKYIFLPNKTILTKTVRL